MGSTNNKYPADYKSYLERGGSRSLEAYNALRLEAHNYVRQYTYGRYPNKTKSSGSHVGYYVEQTINAIVDILSAHRPQDQTIASMGNNGMSVAFRTDIKLEAVIRNTIRRHLGHITDDDGVPLCYAGVDV